MTVHVTFAGDGTIASMKVETPLETANFGRKCAEAAFTDQFIGKTLPVVLGENIDAVSGATVTSQAVVEAVNKLSPVQGARIELSGPGSVLLTIPDDVTAAPTATASASLLKLEWEQVQGRTNQYRLYITPQTDGIDETVTVTAGSLTKEIQVHVAGAAPTLPELPDTQDLNLGGGTAIIPLNAEVEGLRIENTRPDVVDAALSEDARSIRLTPKTVGSALVTVYDWQENYQEIRVNVNEVRISVENDSLTVPVYGSATTKLTLPEGMPASSVICNVSNRSRLNAELAEDGTLTVTSLGYLPSGTVTVIGGSTVATISVTMQDTLLGVNVVMVMPNGNEMEWTPVGTDSLGGPVYLLTPMQAAWGDLYIRAETASGSMDNVLVGGGLTYDAALKAWKPDPDVMASSDGLLAFLQVGESYQMLQLSLADEITVSGGNGDAERAAGTTERWTVKTWLGLESLVTKTGDGVDIAFLSAGSAQIVIQGSQGTTIMNSITVR